MRRCPSEQRRLRGWGRGRARQGRGPEEGSGPLWAELDPVLTSRVQQAVDLEVDLCVLLDQDQEVLSPRQSKDDEDEDEDGL